MTRYVHQKNNDAVPYIWTAWCKLTLLYVLNWRFFLIFFNLYWCHNSYKVKPILSINNLEKFDLLTLQIIIGQSHSTCIICVGHGRRQWCAGSPSHKWVAGDRRRWLGLPELGALKCVNGCIPVFPEHKTRPSIRKNGLHVDIKVAPNRRPWSYERDWFIPNIRPYGLLTGVHKNIESTEMTIYEGA